MDVSIPQMEVKDLQCKEAPIAILDLVVCLRVVTHIHKERHLAELVDARVPERDVVKSINIFLDVRLRVRSY